jgi:negative regulator of sigma-B (phosphoserine phosphatase)
VRNQPGRLEWGVAIRPAVGEYECGDHQVVVSLGSRFLIGVIDALGHGYEASQTGKRAADLIRTHSSQPLPSLMRTCHDALRGSRGAVVSLALVDTVEDRLSWLGTGNVAGALFRGVVNQPRDRRWLPLVPGVVGFRLPSLHPSVEKMQLGNALVIATDGISRQFVEDVDPTLDPEQAANVLLEAHANGDDALVLVARHVRGI